MRTQHLSVFFLFLLFLVASPGWAAITFDTATTNSGEASSFSHSHTTATGSDRLMVVCVSNNDGGTISSITYNSVALTLVGLIDSVGTTQRTSMYRLTAPATGANIFAVSFSNVPRVAIGVLTFQGVDQTTPLGTAVTNGTVGTTTSVNVTSAAEELVVDCQSMQTNTITMNVGSGQTERHSVVNSGSAGGPTGKSSTEPGASTVTMSWSWNGTNQYPAHIAVPLKPVTAVTTQGRRRPIEQ